MKRALLVGINYVGTPNELRGCINDSKNMHKLLTEEFGFTEVKMILEKEATTKGILDGMKWLVAGAMPGDVLLMHYSGHGSQARSDIEPDGLDEIICPIDLNWKDRIIKDDDMKAIFQTVPNGTNVTVILDCCHSGSALDQNETLFDQTKALPVEPEAPEGGRFMPMPNSLQNTIKKKGLEIREFKTSRDVNRSALLIAGCMPHQTSADAFIAGEYQGAATYALRHALETGKKTYREIAESMKAFMEHGEYTQRPQLDGHPSLYDQLFLEPWGTADGQVEIVPAPGTWVEPPPAPPAPEPVPVPVVDSSNMDDSPTANLVVVILLVLAALCFIVLV